MQSATLTKYRAAGISQLLSLSPEVCNDYSPAGIALIHNLLRLRLKSIERLKQRQHWAYCPLVHQALFDAFRLERMAYERLHPVTILRAEASNSTEAQKHAA